MSSKAFNHLGTFPRQPVLSSSHLSNDHLSFEYILSILHLADLHIDIECKLGSNAYHSRPVCCHDGIPKPGELGARFWGDYHTYFLTKIYSCVGDHEPTPSGLFPTDNISWLYSNLASQ
ncbi:unnamed protein product [Rotaria sp. Silwood2]|nr:unnamed protein product [Rotaria sp. Silwood2]